ncbi:MAG: serine/threonine-protein phosphatase, partial [Acidobacteria bacterium]|nr:serine/threonine-protein phosphatase [Acidobacteriota bacterium]
RHRVGQQPVRVVVRLDRPHPAARIPREVDDPADQRLGREQLESEARPQRRQRERVQGELEAGSDIQRQLLPTEVPNIPGFHLDASYTPAREIAGDYWDVVEIEPGRWAVVIADVAGKGVPAALVASLAKGHLSSSLRSGAGPLEALQALNREIRIAPKRRGRLFMTMVLIILDTASGRVSVARAGHEPPLLVRNDGRLETIEPRGLAIGIDPGPRFRSAFDLAEIELAHGDSIVLFTDGLTEAANPRGEQYGHVRLRTLLEDEIPTDGRDISRVIIDSVSAFREGAEPSDDLTLLVLRRVGAGGVQ